MERRRRELEAQAAEREAAAAEVFREALERDMAVGFGGVWEPPSEPEPAVADPGAGRTAGEAAVPESAPASAARPASSSSPASSRARRARGASTPPGESRAAVVPDPAGPQAPAAATTGSGTRVTVSAKDRLRLWTEQSSPEDDEDRDLIRQIRRRVFEETEGMPEREREARARQIGLEMAAKLSSKARQDRVVADVLSTLGGRLGPLDPLMRDPTVSEVLVNAPDEVWVERRGRLERQKLRFRGDREVRTLVEGIAAWAGRKFDWASPVLDCHLADGSRLAAVRYPVAPRGTAVSIRKFPVMPTLEDLRAMGTLPSRDRVMSPSFLRQEAFPTDVDVADFLAWAFRKRVNMVFSGGTSSGKTTTANAAMELIDRGLRVIVIEDSLEMQPPPDLHVVRLERRPPNLEGQGEISLWALLVASLRLRPDVIVVGECRKNETAVMLEAMTTGHPGSMTTVHADSPLDALRRMVRMVRQDMPDTPTAELREYIASAVQLVVQMCRDASSPAGLRMVERVAAVEGVDESGQFIVHDLYRWQGGRLLPTGHVPAWAGEVA
jgi:pilus assembly protein CpaF